MPGETLLPQQETRTDAAPAPARALLVSHIGQRCGVFQFGARLFQALSHAPDPAQAGRIEWHYAECGSMEELRAAEARVRPDILLLNYHPGTLAWAKTSEVRDGGAVVLAVFHEADQHGADQADPFPFHFLLCPDPTLLPHNPVVLPVPRFIPTPLTRLPPLPDIFTIGSFGFATPGKGFDRLCAVVNAEFDSARIRINMPFHDQDAIVPRAQLDAVVASCRTAITRPGIQLDITHDFLDEAGLLAFLAENTINIFTYDDATGRGISSCTDYALAAGRPIAISRSSMFRNLHGINPSIRVEDRPLRAIVASGTAPLRHHRDAYLQHAAGAAWNRAILDARATWALSESVPDGRGFNKLLDDRSRAAYGQALDDLRRLAPDLLDREPEPAAIRQAFALDAAERLTADYAEPRILAIGARTSAAVTALRAKGYVLDEIDPDVNGLDLVRFMRTPEAVPGSYDVIVCVSGLEPAENDRVFVRMAADLLAPGGVAIFTVGFGRKPGADQRLTTIERLRHVLMPDLPDCALLDVPSWDDDGEDFEREDGRNAFAAWVFRKLPAASLRYALPRLIDIAGADWNLRPSAAELRLSEMEEQLSDLSARLEEGTRTLESERAAFARERRLHKAAQEESEALLADIRFAHDAAERRLSALVTELQMDDAPRALRLVLPLARLARRASAELARITGGGPADLPRSELSPAYASSPAPASSAERALVPTAPPRTGTRLLARRAARAGYAQLLRPFARPALHRLRTFMTGNLHGELAAMRQHMEAARHEIARLNAEIATSRSEGPGLRTGIGGSAPHDGLERSLAELSRNLEAALLTLALDRAVPMPAPQASDTTHEATPGNETHTGRSQ